MVGEDFSHYMRTLRTPGLMFRVGTVSMEAYRASLEPGGATLPPLHSSRFVPLPEPTLRTGIRATVDLAMALLPSR
jgi:hippurate hydrolase